MTEDQRKQSQFELFPSSQRPGSKNGGRSAALLKDLTLSQDNIIVLCIVLLMVCIVFFSFGVESGKKGSLAETDVIADVSDVPENIVVMTNAPMANVEPVIVKEQPAVNEEVIEVKQDILDNSLEPQGILDNFYTVQVASFKLEENARKEADKLRSKEFDTFVVPKGTHSIVCVGKFIQKERAKKISDKLKKSYNDCLVRRL